MAAAEAILSQATPKTPTAGNSSTSNLAALLNRLDVIVECDRVTGDDCFVAKAHVASVKELEKLIDQIIPFGSTNTAIIRSSPVAR
jgi:Lrp/AsnC family transcriptional regulator, leucine-responsive regulatory protein